MISLTAASALVLLMAGCGSIDDRQAAAAGTAVRFLTAVQNKDGTAACAALAPTTAQEVAQSADKACPDAILDEDLPAPAPVRSSAVYGQWAQVHLADDTVFLAVVSSGWRVVAAGCRSQGDRPYECTLSGG
jgi:uncharacterized protein YceK